MAEVDWFNFDLSIWCKLHTLNPPEPGTEEWTELLQDFDLMKNEPYVAMGDLNHNPDDPTTWNPSELLDPPLFRSDFYERGPKGELRLELETGWSDWSSGLLFKVSCGIGRSKPTHHDDNGA